MVEVVGLDVGDHGHLGGQGREGAVALVGLEHQPLAAVPDGVGAHLAHVGPDEEGRPKPRLHQHEREHRAGGGLAVGAGHGQAPAGGGDGRQHLGPAHHRQVAPGRLGQLGVVGGHRRRGGDQVGRADLVGPVADRDRHALGHQPVHHRRAAQVTPGHRVAHGGQHGGDGAHPRPAHPHHVDPPRYREVDRGRVAVAALSGHGRPPPRPPGRPRRDGRRPGPPPPMAASRPGSAKRPSRIASSRSGSQSASGRSTPRARGHQGPGVGRLVIARRPGQRDQHRRHAGYGQLGHGDRPGPADDHVGRLVEEVHAGLEGDEPQAQAACCPGVGAPHGVPVPPAGHVVEGAVGAPGPPSGQARRCAVDRAGPERPSEHADHGPVGREAELAPGLADRGRGAVDGARPRRAPGPRSPPPWAGGCRGRPRHWPRRTGRAPGGPGRARRPR